MSKIKTITLSIALGAILLSGCSKDSAYDCLTDSDGIDLTMQVAKGLTLPFGSSSKIYLTELMDTAAVSQLKADDDGQFYLEMKGTLTESTFFVNETPVSFFPDIKKLSFSFMIDQSSLPQEVKQVLPSLKEGDDLSRFQSLTLTIFRKEISLAGNASFDIYREDIDPALLSVSSVWPQEPVMVDVSINLSHLPAQRKDLQAKNFRVILPKYVVMQQESAPGEFLLQDITMNDVTAEEIEWSETFVATALDFSRDDQGALIVDNGTVNRPGEMDVIGDVYISEYNCKGSELYIQLDEDGNKIVAMKQPVEVEFLPVVEVPDLMLSKVIGKFKPNITETETCVNIDLGEKTQSAMIKEGTEVKHMGIEGGNSNGSYLSDLTISETDAIASLLSQNWNLDPGAIGIEGMVVKIRVHLGKDGSIKRIWPGSIYLAVKQDFIKVILPYGLL